MTPEELLSSRIKKSDKTYNRIANEAGVSFSTVESYANERSNFSQLYNIEAVSNVVGLSIADLLDAEHTFELDNLSELVCKIENWFYDRNLHTQEPSKQFLKVAEEVGELGGALARQDKDLIEDALGDVFVTLIGISMQTDIDFTGAVQTAYDEIKDRKGRLVGGVFVKDEE